MSYNNNKNSRTAVPPENLQVGKKYSKNSPTSGFGELDPISSDSRYEVGVNLNWFVVIQKSQNSMSGWSWKPVFVARWNSLKVADARDVDSFGDSFAELAKQAPGQFFDYLSDSGGRDPEIEEISRVDGNQIQMVIYSTDLGRAEVTLTQ